MRSKSIRPYAILFFLNILFCCFFFYPILGDLNHIMLSNGGDGIKNYFTYLYFISHDTGTHFTGMNYPFGEHIVFTDNMPALAWPVAHLRAWFPGIVHYGLLIMHITFIISYILCSFYVYKILRLFNVKGWWAIASAIFIAYFSPQFSRIFGHFGLGLCCFFPMMIYWLMQYDRRKVFKYLAYIYCCAVVFTFLHVYYLAFTLVLTAAYSFACLITRKQGLTQKKRTVIPVLITLAAAIITFKGCLKITDTVTDRPVNPLGYLDAVSTLPDLLTSGYNFIGHYAFLWMFEGMASKSSEGYAYLGFVTLICVFFLLFRIMRSLVLRLFKKVKVPAHPVRSYRKWLVVALLALLFSMGIPFIWKLDFLVNYFSALKQFRTLGRFAWITYYLMMIYASVFLFRCFTLMRLKGYNKSYIAIASLVLLIWAIEWNGYGQEIRMVEANAKGNYDQFYSVGQPSWSEWLKQRGYPADRLQGIIGLPYLHVGAEKVNAQDDLPTVMYAGSQIAMNTGLKMVDVMMSRTSWSQTFENLKLTDGPFTPMPIIDRFNNKPFLVFVNYSKPLTPGEETLIARAIPIGQKDGLDFYVLDIKAMERTNRRYTDSIAGLAMNQPQKEGLLHNDTSFYYTQHFDNTSNPDAFAGKGSFKATTNNTQLLWSVPFSHPTNDSVFILSAWFHCMPDQPNMAYIVYKVFDKKGHFLTEGDFSSMGSRYERRGWFRSERKTVISKQAARINFYIYRGPGYYSAVDELMIYPANSIHFYKPDESSLMLNNRPVTIKK